MPPKIRFVVGEKLLCYQGPIIYEGKCLNSIVTKAQHVLYLIHYCGWNKNWDEWVPDSRLLKYTANNLKKQKAVQEAHAAQIAKSKNTAKKAKRPAAAAQVDPPVPRATRASTLDARNARNAAPTPAKRPRKSPKPAPKKSQPTNKRRRLNDSEEVVVEQSLTKATYSVSIPQELRLSIVDDWDIINRQHKLVSLPAKLTVDKIVDNYLALNSGCKKTIVNGIKDYFNVLLGSQLLYSFERPQYADLLKEYRGIPPSRIFGAVHLLRMFVKLGSMLSDSKLDEKAIKGVLVQMELFLQYMLANKSTLFNWREYINVSLEYYRRLP